jgi:hypothetical protein
VALRARQLARDDALGAVGAQGQARQGRHAQSGGHQRLHDHHVVRGVADPRLEPLVRAQGEQVAAAPLAAGDPGLVAQGGQPAPAAGREQVDRIVEQRMQPDAGRLGLGLVVAEDDRDLDLAGPQQLERLGRMRVGQADLQAWMRGGQPRHRVRDERPDGRGEPGQAHPPGAQPHVSGELCVGGIDAADDLGCAIGQQLPGRGETDAAADPLEQLRAGLGLQPGDVVGDRRLGVVQLPGRRGHRSVACDGVDDPQPIDVQHALTLSMNQHESRHLTYDSIRRKLRACSPPRPAPSAIWSTSSPGSVAP